MLREVSHHSDMHCTSKQRAPGQAACLFITMWLLISPHVASEAGVELGGWDIKLSQQFPILSSFALFFNFLGVWKHTDKVSL